MGNTHSAVPYNGKLSRKFSRQSRKDDTLPHMHTTNDAQIHHKKYKGSLPPSPNSSSDPKPLPNSKTIDDIPANRGSKYILPNNEEELDRLVQVHFIYKYLFGDNFSAPVKDLLSSNQLRRNSGSSHHQRMQDSPSLLTLSPPRVLDIACGNGTWILEMATEFPESQFHGIDILANYPTTVKPANTFFCQHDILHPKGLPYPDDYFDYIHMRQVYSCFSEQDWVTVMKEIKRLLKPGGYVELRDIDPMLNNMGPITSRFFAKFPLMMKKWHGVNILWARHMFDIMNDVGDMADTHIQVNALQFGLPGPIGNMIQNSLRLALKSFRLFFETHNSLPDRDYDKVIDDIIEETSKYRSYFNYYCCWGRNHLYETMYHGQERRGDSCSGDEQPRRYSVTNNNNITLNSDTNANGMSSTFAMRRRSEKKTQSEHADDAAMPSPNILSIYPLSDRHQHHLVSLGEENVSDIDQFAEGYED
ncbi:type 11 methyltransferase [Mucor ambiguus]|uniref:Type 11 methyltransferase n=1 Tax=Mucor ambiguus TaxID=91626 RepID=A0A0C9ML39_9FUNG|nr:type 11 methyltransferase [Mucor ambiguus]